MSLLRSDSHNRMVNCVLSGLAQGLLNHDLFIIPPYDISQFASSLVHQFWSSFLK